MSCSKIALDEIKSILTGQRKGVTNGHKVNHTLLSSLSFVHKSILTSTTTAAVNGSRPAIMFSLEEERLRQFIAASCLLVTDVWRVEIIFPICCSLHMSCQQWWPATFASSHQGPIKGKPQSDRYREPGYSTSRQSGDISEESFREELCHGSASQRLPLW